MVQAERHTHRVWIKLCARGWLCADVLVAMSTILAIWMSVLVTPAWAEDTVTARVAYVGDGDTIWLDSWLPASQARQRVRILGIDAPEICQEGGVAARDALREKIQGQAVRLLFEKDEAQRKDAYGRWLARLELPTMGAHGAAQAPMLDVGRWLVAEGHAWSSASPGQRSRYRAEQAAARSAKKGLWHTPDQTKLARQNLEQTQTLRPLAPWRFRRINGPCALKNKETH